MIYLALLFTLHLPFSHCDFSLLLDFVVFFVSDFSSFFKMRPEGTSAVRFGKNQKRCLPLVMSQMKRNRMQGATARRRILARKQPAPTPTLIPASQRVAAMQAIIRINPMTGFKVNWVIDLHKHLISIQKNLIIMWLKLEFFFFSFYLWGNF